MNGNLISAEIMAADWAKFSADEKLTEKQVAQFQRYMSLLQAWNKNINLTAIVKIPNIIRYHFQDSLALAHQWDMRDVKTLVDVGSGAGFPGIPLKIKFPELKVILIEVNSKKLNFLRTVIQELGLQDIIVYGHDWLTFLRSTDYTVDLFCARASLKMPELLRLFRPGCQYKQSALIYWGSRLWEPTDLEAPYIIQQNWYKIGHKRRKLIVMKGVK